MNQITKMNCGVYRIDLSDGTIGFFARALELTMYTGIKYPTASFGSWVLDVEQHPPMYFKNYQRGRAYIRRVYQV